MHPPIANEIMLNEESHNHMESEMSIVIEALLQMREKLFKATGLNISLAQREQKESNTIQMSCTTVLKENTRQKQCKGGNPYSINRCIGKDVYEFKKILKELS